MDSMVVKIRCHLPDGIYRFATEPIRDDEGNWEDCIISISNLTKNIGENNDFEVSGVTIEIVGLYKIEGEELVEIIDGSNQTIFKGTIQRCSKTENTTTIEINDMSTELETEITEVISREVYSNCCTAAEGKVIPSIFGDVNAPGGAISAWRVDTGKYLASDCHILSIYQVFIPPPDSTEIFSYSVDENVDGRTYINYTQDEEPDYLNFNAVGKGQGTQPITDPIEVLKEKILKTDMGIYEDSFSSAQEIMNARNYKFTGVIVRETTLLDFLKDFCISFDCDFYLFQSLLYLFIFDFKDLAPSNVFYESQIDIRIDNDFSKRQTEAKYQYRYNFAEGKDYYQKTPLISKDSTKKKRGRPFNFLYVSDDNTAWDVAQRRIIQTMNAPAIAKISLAFEEYQGLELTSLISVQHSIHLEEKPKIYQIRSSNINVLDNNANITGRDITLLSGAVAKLGDINTLPGNWENASENDRQYAYLADIETGCFADGKPGKVLY